MDKFFRDKRRLIRLWATNAIATLKHGVSSSGLNLGMLKWVKTSAAKLTRGGGQGGCQATALLLQPELDKSRELIAAPILKYNTELYETTSPEQSKPKHIPIRLLSQWSPAAIKVWEEGPGPIRSMGPSDRRSGHASI